MVSPVVSAQCDDRRQDLQELFVRYGSHMIPVVDEHDRLLGVIHSRDIKDSGKAEIRYATYQNDPHGEDRTLGLASLPARAPDSDRNQICKGFFFCRRPTAFANDSLCQSVSTRRFPRKDRWKQKNLQARRPAAKQLSAW